MEDEIKVGEYVRTKKDGICKLLNIENDYMWCGYVDKPFWLRKDNIVKHSKNVIDLIEVRRLCKWILYTWNTKDRKGKVFGD